MRKTASEPENGAQERPVSLLHAGDLYLAAAVGALAFFVYFRTLAPTITGEDSSELIGAAYTLGIPHPPGYPLWTMLAHAITWIPVSTVAWRVNLLSAVFGAAAVSTLVLLAQCLVRNRLAAAAAGLAFAFSLDFWQQSVVAEVYTLNTFLFTLCLLLLVLWKECRGNGLLVLFAMVYGISLGNHNTMHLLGPWFALFVLAVERPRPKRLVFYAFLTFISLGLAFLLYLYLPLRSAQNPGVDWGNPETLSNWWGVVSRKQYAFMYSQYPRGWARHVEQMHAMATLWGRQFTPGTGLCCLAGLLLLLRRQFWLTLWLAGVALFVVAAFAFIQNFNLDKEWLWVMRVFGLPAYLITALGLAALVAGVWRGLGKTPAVALALGCVLLPLATHWATADKSEYYWAEDYGRNTLLSLAPDALYFPDGDHASFSARHLQVVEGLRPDVYVGRKYGYLDLSIAPELRAEYGEFPKKRHEEEIIGKLLEKTSRPVYLQQSLRFTAPSGVRCVPAGLLYRALRPGEIDASGDPWPGYSWHTLSTGEVHGDFTAQLILCEIYFAEADKLLNAEEESKAIAKIELGLTLYGREYAMLNNAGVLCARHGLRSAARAYFEEALTKPDADAAARRNIERLH